MRPRDLRAPDPDLRARWDALALASGAAPFMRPGWLGAWADAFGRADDLRVLTVERRGELVGVLPLLPGPLGLRAPTNHETARFAPVLADDEAATELADRLLAAGTTVDLGALAVESPATPALRAAAGRAGAPSLERPVCVSPWIDTTGDPASFLARLSKNRRHGLRRLRHRMADVGEVVLDVRDGTEHLDALLDEGFGLEARPWKLAAGSAIRSSPASVRFYTEAARWAAAEGILRLVHLRIDGRGVAFGYCLRQGGTLSFLKLGMDDELAKLGPGVVLTHHLVDHCCSDPELVELDLLGDSESYKADLASGTREQVRLQVFGHRLTGSAHRAALASAARLRAEAVSRMSDDTRARLSAWRNRWRPGGARVSASRSLTSAE
ncbi:GNAT family N-acetyltransferase [Actinomycetospora endophytica]|uniref:GNAT family N-acetyltransferase n=1 Tax=Actinomycetospora endophytica TaxID=2291215 RepID=A0ABS8PEL4_9PSEU|nr:GNAT family N-acetyltransferase [Actinomycetospora endophytica]MCD2196716.1 GNAT family N-acetyltransferase [Actinomycetospora endophytica]